jgi:hypothetical protein
MKRATRLRWMRRSLGSLVLSMIAACGPGQPQGSTIEASQRASYRGPGALVTAPAPCPDDGAASQAELSVVTGRTLAIIDEGLASVRDARDAARRDRDVEWAVCLDEKLTRLRTLRVSAVSRATEHTDDSVEVAPQVAQARELCESARAAVTEATHCTSVPAPAPPPG